MNCGKNNMDIKEYQELSQFLLNGKHHHASWLHSYGSPEGFKKAEKFIEKRTKGILKFLERESNAGSRLLPKDISLNVLVVENNIKAFKAYQEIGLRAARLWETGGKISWYIKEKEFSKWETELRREKQHNKPAIEVKPIDWDNLDDIEKTPPVSISCCEIDLVLQDIFLSNSLDSPLGYQLTDHYFDLMPQAIVFLLTSMDVEHLSASGISHRADAVISKTRMSAIWWYYYQAFIELFGFMFWEPWSKNDEDRPKLRGLFGCLRRWIKEPEILWHGQNLPEMVDHGHQHITELWSFSREILGTAIELSPKFAREFNTEMRILVALGIWLHDVGHRGDSFNTDPISIRDSHGAISEKLLFENPEAFGLGWLLMSCEYWKEPFPGGCTSESRQGIRNTVEPAKKLCMLRKLGLICRSHQSSAPIWMEKIEAGFHGLKFPGVYTRIGFKHDSATDSIKEKPSNESIREWQETNLDLDWIGSDIRCLEDYGDEKLIELTCLLRWLDALHTSKRRTGSQIKQNTHKLFLKEREKWCENRFEDLAGILETSSPGSSSYIKALSEQGSLLAYYNLLKVQDIHLWRHDAVDHIRISSEKEGGSRIAITITYDVFPKEITTKEVKEQLKAQQEKILEDLGNPWGDLNEALLLWATHMYDDVIKSEMDSQKKGSKSIVENFFGSLDIRIYFSFKGINKDRKLLWPPPQQHEA